MRAIRHIDVGGVMEPGLSRRSLKVLAATCDGGGAGGAPQQQQQWGLRRHHRDGGGGDGDDSAVIDLSRATNEVVYPELLEFFKSTVEGVGCEVFATPASPSAGNGHHGSEPRLRNALAGFFNTHFQPVHAVRPEHVVVTAGATGAIEGLVAAVCDEGDGIVVVGPCWPTLLTTLTTKHALTLTLAKPPTYTHWDNYLLPSLQASYDFSPAKSRIKAVLLCNPNTPLSRCYPRETLLDLMEFCQERGLHLICDEVGALLRMDGGGGGGFVSALGLTEPLAREGARKLDPSRVHVVWSGSKLFGLGGLKVGCIISQHTPPLLAALSTLCPPPSSLSALYLTALLSWSQLPTLLALTTERLTASYRILASFLQRHSIEFVVPTHGVVLFARLASSAKSKGEESRFFEALERSGIRVGRGDVYGGVERCWGWAGLGFGVERGVMEEAVRRMEGVMGGQGR